VEEPKIIFQIHLQTYDIEVLETLVEHVESLHVIIDKFLPEYIKTNLNNMHTLQK